MKQSAGKYFDTRDDNPETMKCVYPFFIWIVHGVMWMLVNIKWQWISAKKKLNSWGLLIQCCYSIVTFTQVLTPQLNKISPIKSEKTCIARMWRDEHLSSHYCLVYCSYILFVKSYREKKNIISVKNNKSFWSKAGKISSLLVHIPQNFWKQGWVINICLKISYIISITKLIFI